MSICKIPEKVHSQQSFFTIGSKSTGNILKFLSTDDSSNNKDSVGNIVPPAMLCREVCGSRSGGEEN